MRDGWTETTLNTVLLPVLTRARDNSEYEVLSVTERRGIIPQTEVFKHRIATDDISKYKVLQPGDIAFNPYLLWCGAVGQWKGNYEGVVSPVYECFRVRETDSPRFVGLIFESGVLTPYFDSTAIGSIVRRRRTTLPVFYEAPIFRPPLVEQKRIVDVVSSVDCYIDALQQQADSARTARNAVLHELLSAGGDDWTDTTLGDIAKFVRGPFGGSLKKEIFVQSGFAVYEQQHAIYGDFVNFRYFVNKEKFDEMKRFSVSTGDLLMSCSGTVGKVSLVPPDAPAGIINQALLKISTSSQVSSAFLLYWTQSEIFHLLIQENSGGAVQQNVASVKLLKDIRITLPPIDEQKRIVEIVSSMDEVIHSTEQAVVDAKNLRSGLLSDLLSGEHEIPASYDSLLGAA